MSGNSDIKENDIVRYDEGLMPLLLIDRTRSNDEEVHNIIWATDNYLQNGPEYAECGVKSGDRIVYTPTGAVLTVKGDHEVEYEGETYTLAQFTAKFMPRNKRSVSGVCQGPKYFTKGGTSLYQMKETFLGGKK